MLALLLLNLARFERDVYYGGKQFPKYPAIDVSTLPTQADKLKKKKKKVYSDLRFVPLSELEEVVERAKGFDIPQMQEKVEEISSLFTPRGVSTIEDLFDRIEENNEKFKDVLSNKELIDRVQYLEEWIEEEELMVVLIQND